MVRISDIPGPRWDLALEMIAAAGPLTVLEGEPPVGLQRYVFDYGHGAVRVGTVSDEWELTLL